MKYSYILLIFLLLNACSPDIESISESWTASKELIEHKIIEFPLDSLTRRYNNQLVFSETEDKLYLYNNYIHAFYKYNLKQPSEYKVTNLPKNGSEAVGEISAFYVINKDSIITINSVNKNLYIINNQGEKLSETKILEEDENGLPLRFSIFIKMEKFIYLFQPTFYKGQIEKEKPTHL